ncbi:MAG: hypothetical protein QM523_04145 [Candidatus Pacebacteria bacterium]|nr:hypothetical protein [Candidatus Paceibacterota bacterium]
MRISFALLFYISIPVGIVLYNLIAGGTPFYNMTPLSYFLYFVVPAVGVLGYFIAKMETVEEKKKRLQPK